MFVRNRFTIEMYGLRIVYVTFWHMPLTMPSHIARWHGDWGRGLGG